MNTSLGPSSRTSSQITNKEDLSIGIHLRLESRTPGQSSTLNSATTFIASKSHITAESNKYMILEIVHHQCHVFFADTLSREL